MSHEGEILDHFSPAVQRWWIREFGDAISTNSLFTPPQQEAIPAIANRSNVLIAAPTGSGKTQASFAPIIDDLYSRQLRDDLANTVYCLYISPLKSLANDIHRNLEQPLERIHTEYASRGIDVTPPRHAIRHGDTPQAVRNEMRNTTPHILNTTPETLAILLNAPSFREKLRSVEYVIVDEIHALADSKRGTHLAVSLERLAELTEQSFTRIGCSATIEPLDRIASFLAGYEDGTQRPINIIDTRFTRDYDLQLKCPVPDLMETNPDTTRDAFYTDLVDLIRSHTTTLVFTNSRSGAERVLTTLHEQYGFNESNAACHHGSLSPEQRQPVEAGLKNGTFDVVTTSTSLELGIDMHAVDLVVQVGSPKSISSFLQRVGRAGHKPGETVKGRLFALDWDELVECAVLLDAAERQRIDTISPPLCAHDVAAQHVYGMAINAIWNEDTMYSVLTRAYPYQEYSREDWELLMQYLTGAQEDLQRFNIYPKIWRDTNDNPTGDHHYPDFTVGEPLIGSRGRLANPIYMTNIGTIPDSFECDVIHREEDTWIGTLDEDFLDTLSPGDVFVLGGKRLQFKYRRGGNIYVDYTDAEPTVPSWFAERMPLSYELGQEILTFQSTLQDILTDQGIPALREWLRSFAIDENSVRSLTRMYVTQYRYLDSPWLSTDSQILIDEVLNINTDTRRYYIHTPLGRRFNEGLANILKSACQFSARIRISATDSGCVIEMPKNQKVDLERVINTLDPTALRSMLKESLTDSELLKRYFRMNANRSLMILKHYKGNKQSATKQQVTSEMVLSHVEEGSEFAVLEETYRELIDDYYNFSQISQFISSIQNGEITLVQRSVPSPSPRVIGLASLHDSEAQLTSSQTSMQEHFATIIENIEDGETSQYDLQSTSDF